MSAPPEWRAVILSLLPPIPADLEPMIDAWWDLVPEGSPDNVTANFVRLQLLDSLLARAASGVSFQALDGASVDLSDYYDHLLSYRNIVADELGDLALSGGGGGSLGLLTRVAPEEAPCGEYDANSPRYRGSPYRALPYRRRI